jgi:hypothetical protein
MPSMNGGGEKIPFAGIVEKSMRQKWRGTPEQQIFTSARIEH